jgi:methylglyoxal synthase
MEKIKTIALVAHDSRKKDLIEWIEFNWETISECKLVCTGTTGRLVKNFLQNKGVKFDITLLKSGPLGGDVELSALISEGEIDFLLGSNGTTTS